MTYKDYVSLTSHPGEIYKNSIPILWGEKDPHKRGPVVASLTDYSKRNVIGTHSGGYVVYRALAAAAGQLELDHRPDLTNTTPVWSIKPNDNWFDPKKIVSLDPFGAGVADYYKPLYKKRL